MENLYEKYIKAPLELTRSKFNIEINEDNAAICYRSEGLEGLQHPWDDENIRVLQTAAGPGGQFFTLRDIRKFTDAVLAKDERLYSEKMYELAERQYAPACASESRGLGCCMWMRSICKPVGCLTREALATAATRDRASFLTEKKKCVS